MTNTGFFIPLTPAAGIALFITSALRKGQIDMTLKWGRGTLSCCRSQTPGNFWLFIGTAGFVALALIALALFLALAKISN